MQVKSQSTLAEFLAYADWFNRDDFRRLFYVVHTPAADLAGYEAPPDSGVVLVPPRQLSLMAVDAGLVGWVLEKTIWKRTSNYTSNPVERSISCAACAFSSHLSALDTRPGVNGCFSA